MCLTSNNTAHTPIGIWIARVSTCNTAEFNVEVRNGTAPDQLVEPAHEQAELFSICVARESSPWVGGRKLHCVS